LISWISKYETECITGVSGVLHYSACMAAYWAYKLHVLLHIILRYPHSLIRQISRCCFHTNVYHLEASPSILLLLVTCRACLGRAWLCRTGVHDTRKTIDVRKTINTKSSRPYDTHAMYQLDSPST
jgi:hypothetical protein